MKVCNRLQIKQAFTSYNNPKGNADTERVVRITKEELICLQEWTSPSNLKTELGTWIENYNRRYPHSSLGYLTPNQFENIYQNPLQNAPGLAPGEFHFENTLLKSA